MKLRVDRQRYMTHVLDAATDHDVVDAARYE